MKRFGVPTDYRGIQFRSRLEARWAVFFDTLAWDWTYEPFDLPGWIPDFLIHGSRPLLVEIKPLAYLGEYKDAIEPYHRHDHYDVLILGTRPNATGKNGEIYGWQPGNFDSAGLICDPDFRRFFNVACWCRCGKCGSVSIWDSVYLYTCRPCGHGDGDHYLIPLPSGALEAEWTEACNRTQWNGNG